MDWNDMAPGLLNKLLDADTHTDMEAMYGQELPCEIGQLSTGGAPWCVEIGDWLIQLRCSKCGVASKFIACIVCKDMVQRVFRIAQLLTLFVKPRKCPHRMLNYRVSYVKL